MTFNKFYLFVYSTLLALALISCNDDDITCCDNMPTSGNVIIVNEGQFGQGNASMDVFNAADETIQNKAFSSANSRGLGDVFQSITFHDEKMYLFVNASQRIEVIDEVTFESIATITGMSSPRYGAVIGNEMYVSDLFSPVLYKIDLTTNMVSGTIDLPVAVEELVVVNDKIYASALSFSTLLNEVYIIDPVTEDISTIEVGNGPEAMVKDANDNIWVYCSGFFTDSLFLPQSLHHINTSNNTVEKSFDFAGQPAAFPARLAMDVSDNRTIYFTTSTGVKRMSIDAQSAPLVDHFSYSGSIYGLAVDPDTKDMYIGDAGNFVDPGMLSIFSEDGMLMSTYETGVSPGRIYFN